MVLEGWRTQGMWGLHIALVVSHLLGGREVVVQVPVFLWTGSCSIAQAGMQGSDITAASISQAQAILPQSPE